MGQDSHHFDDDNARLHWPAIFQLVHLEQGASPHHKRIRAGLFFRRLDLHLLQIPNEIVIKFANITLPKVRTSDF